MDNNRARRLNLWTIAIVVLLLAAYLGALAYSRPRASGQTLRFDSFVDLVETDRVTAATIRDRDGLVVGRYEKKDGSTAEYNVSYFNAETVRESLVNLLVVNKVPTTIDKQFGKSLVAPATLLLPTLILITALAYLILSWRWGTGLFGATSESRKVDAGTVRFADVAGQDAAIADLREIVEFLKHPQASVRLGVRVPKGVLLYGPPGCGKTLLARAVAGEADVPFFSITGSDFVELYQGVGAARVRELFREAREHPPAIVFIDELDAVGRARGALGPVMTQGEQEQALNQILAELDGFSSSSGIVVLAATNRADVLDPALLRPGRFDRTISLERPDEEARLEILQVHTRGKEVASGVDLRAIASKAFGMTGADLAGVVNDAALIAARADKPGIDQSDLQTALQRISEEPERQRRSAMGERSIGRRTLADEGVTFADVAGVDEAVAELAEIRDYLAQPERFERLGAAVPRGILLVGPPGCGKTLLARAVAGESHAAFFSVAASEFVEIFVGQGAARVRELFAEARAGAPAILFIDELDSIGTRRSESAPGGSRETEQTLNQILIELDGFTTSSGVIVIAATNRPDMLDPALIRRGRFDRHVTVDAPDRAGRRAILALHSKGKRLGSDVDLDKVAGLTSGFSGADLASVLNEAALLTARRNADEISMSDVEQGIERAMMGISARRRLMSDDERRAVAVHEAGHAVVSIALPGTSPPHKLTIVPRGRVLGFSWNPDEADRWVSNRDHLIDEMAGLLGARAAEQMVLGQLGDGAANDLRIATDIARRMVCDLGMSEKLGPLSTGDPHDGREPKPLLSEETAGIIDAEIRAVIDEADRRAADALRSHRDILDRVVEALLEKETLGSRELSEIWAAARPALPLPTGL
jgi:ATP-dependent metalloprotease FtsH